MTQTNTFSIVDVSSWRTLESFEARVSCLETPTFGLISDILDFRVSLLEAKVHANEQHYTVNAEHVNGLALRIARLEEYKGIVYNFREEIRVSEELVVCPDKSCKENFHRAGDLTTHYRRKHGPLFQSISMQSKCYPCGTAFPSSKALTDHEITVHKEKYLSRSELFLPMFHIHQAQMVPGLSETQNRTTTFASLTVKEKILGPMIYAIHPGLKSLSARSSGTVSLLLLLPFLGTDIPKVLLDRGCSPRRRWSDDCELGEITPIQAGLDPGLVLFLSNKTALSKAIQTLLSLSLLGSEKTGNDQEIFTFNHKLRNSIIKLLPQSERDFWSIQATALFCHAFYRSQKWEDVYASKILEL